jgi:hypothetical protein
LPAERIRIYGVDRSRNGKIETKDQKVHILDEQITHQCSKQISGIRWIKGAYPQMGAIIEGKNGYETVQKFTRYL